MQRHIDLTNPTQKHLGKHQTNYNKKQKKRLVNITGQQDKPKKNKIDRRGALSLGCPPHHTIQQVGE